MVMSFGQGMVAPTIPVLAASFGVSIGFAAQAVTAQVAGRTVALIPVGMIIDRFGRKPALLGGPILIACASLLAATTLAFPLLLLAQFLTGVGSSMWQTSREIVAVDVVQPGQRGRMMSGFMGTSSVGLALGPVLGGIVSDLFGFRSVFWVYGLIALATFAISLRIRETSSRPQSRRSLLNLGSVKEVEPYFRVTYVVLIVNTFVAMMRGALITSMVPLYVGVQLGYSSTQVGTIFGVYGLVNFLMIAPTGLLLDTRGRKAVVVPSTLIAAAVFALFPLASQMWQLSALGGLTGVATGLALGSMATYTYDVIPAHARGRLQTLRRIIGDSGALAGPVVGGLVADRYGAGTVFWLFVPLQLIAGGLIIFVARESLAHVKAQAKEAGEN
jgi:MFS family permease